MMRMKIKKRLFDLVILFFFENTRIDKKRDA